MAKKIIISFISQPTLGEAFGYYITINNVKIVYNSGVNSVNATYATTASPPQKIKLQPTLEENILNTLNTLTTFFKSDSVIYTREDNKIIVLVSSENSNAELLGGVNSGLTIEIQDVPTAILGLKYFLDYINIVGDRYLCNIFKKNYGGSFSEIFGNVTIEKGSVKTHLEPIRGTGLLLELEASKDFSLEDLYTENEQDFTVQLYKNGLLVYIGYLKPDGVFQDYVRDEWRLNLECVDGLGAIKNLSFVQENGLQFRGKYTALDIIYYCLKRSGITLNINTSVNILYDGLAADANTDVLSKIYLSTERYFKKDGDTQGAGTIMSCEDVLKSILDIFAATITQQNGEWFIYKANEIFLNSNVLFRRYNVSNEFMETRLINLAKVLGSQIDNFYPHHSGGNQRIEINGGVSAFRIGYKYGFLTGLLSNPTFFHDVNDYTPYQILAPNSVVYDPATDVGLRMNTITNNQNSVLVARSENIPLLIGNSFSFDTNITAANDSLTFNFKVRLGSYYLNSLGEWVLTDSKITYIFGARGDLGVNKSVNSSFKISSLNLPISGDVFIEIYKPIRSFGNSSAYGVINTLDIVNTFKGNNIDGEFHTVQRSVKISSIVKENKEVLHGDNDGIVYNGAIFKEDQVSLTSSWNRKNFIGSFSILRIAAEEELRIAQKPLKIFTGDAYGFIDYLSVLNINNIGNKFMPIEYSYNTKTNVTKLKSLQLFSEEIADIKHELTLDYGTTVKPTIKG
tara:strand:+ start:1789 stop:4008 length:2220 start_codon:yes stop_codon:yes gene_type:complete